MPLFVKPKRKLSVQDVKNAMRNHYEGTALDISNEDVYKRQVQSVEPSVRGNAGGVFRSLSG